MEFDWKVNGFAAPPVPGLAKGNEKLYRAWGGYPGRKWGNKDLPGVCFSLDRAESRWQAEMLYSVMEYQNPVWHLTEFSVPKDAPLWIGKVHPGDPRAIFGNISGSQVLIARAYVHFVKEVETTTLRNDLGSSVVYTGKMPRVHS